MVSTIKARSSWLQQNDLRLDASYYGSDGQKEARLFIDSTIEKKELHELTQNNEDGIFIPGRFKRIYVGNHNVGYPYITGSLIVQTDPLKNCNYLSRKYTKKIERLLLNSGDIIVTCSGNIGNTVLISDYFIGSIGSPDLLRIVPDSTKILPGYLYAYLSSKIGKALITQKTYGSVIQHIEAHHIKDLPVPILNKNLIQKVHDLIEESSNLRTYFSKERSKAVYAIDKILDRQTYYNNNALSFRIESNEILSSNDKYTNELRLEADYYLPHIKNNECLIESKTYGLLGDLAISIKCSGIRQRVFVEKGVPFITGQDLNKIRLDHIKQISKIFTRNIEEGMTKENDILVSCLGTIGKVEYCHKNFYDNIFPSQQIIKISIDKSKIHPGFVYLFLSSALGQQQLLKYKTGSVIEWIRENHVASIRIPIPKDKGFKLGEKANFICEKSQQALDLENEAISIIEKELSKWLD